MTDLFRAHPTAIVDGALIDNPCYSPAARFVARLRGRPINVLRDRFLTALVAGAQAEALEILLDEAVGEDVPVPKLYLEVVQPALQQIGRLRQEKRISEIQVDVAVDIVQAALVHLRPLLPACAPGAHTVMVATA
jgi:methanogenic corrinoid protein MtbC1